MGTDKTNVGKNLKRVACWFLFLSLCVFALSEWIELIELRNTNAPGTHQIGARILFVVATSLGALSTLVAFFESLELSQVAVALAIAAGTSASAGYWLYLFDVI